MNLDLMVVQNQLIRLFEQHLFMLPDPLPDNLSASVEGDYLKTEMQFNGLVNGKFIMLFPVSKCKEIISNYLGLEIDDPEILQMSNMDAASEIMNILGAHILSGWNKNGEPFTIGIPSTLCLNSYQDFFNHNRDITGIIIDGSPVYFKTVVE